MEKCGKPEPPGCANFIRLFGEYDWIPPVAKRCLCSNLGRHAADQGGFSGKTALVRRVAAEIRTQAALCDRWYPIVFAEEAYEVGTPGGFWLTALFHLSDQTYDPNLLRAYEVIRMEGV